MKKNELVKITEASQVLKVHPNTLRRWDKLGLLKSVRFGERKDRHYRLSDIKEVMEGKSESSTTQSSASIEERIVESEISKRMLEKINIASARFLIPLEPEETYAVIIEEAKKLTNADFGSVFLLEGDRLNRVYASSTILHKMKPRKTGRTYQALKDNKASTYKVKSFKEPHPMLKRLDIKSVVYIPLSSEGNTTGVLNLLASHSATYTPKELELFKLFGTLASLAIVKTRLYAETKNSLDNQRLYHSLASHEIKTPLTSIFAYSQLVEKKLLKKERIPLEAVKKISQETMRTIKMIDSFLGRNGDTDSNVYSSHKPCNLKEVIERAISDFNALYPKRRLDFDDNVKSEKAIVSGDFDKLLQAVINLLTNSGKYSREGEKIRISLANSGKTYKLSVHDKGEGIDKNKLKHVFEKFYRADIRTKNGMGLGLYLVKMIIDEHRGIVSAKSRPGHGSTFTLELPRGE